MSRYYDYDYDRNCIIGFGPDSELDEDGMNTSGKLSKCSSYRSLQLLSPSSSQSIESTPIFSNTHSSNSSSSHSHSIHNEYLQCTLHEHADQVEEDELVFILPADSEAIKQRKLKPCIVDEPFQLIGDMLKQEAVRKAKGKKTKQAACAFGDSFDLQTTDCNLWIQHGVSVIDAMTNNSAICQQMKRFDDFNGSFYNSFGVGRVETQQCHVWRFQVLGNAATIIGIVESEAPHKTCGAYFGCETNYASYSYNTITAETYSSTQKSAQPKYQQMLKCPKLDKPMLVDMKLDLVAGTMSIANKTPHCQHFGKEIILFDKIDTSKTYKLALAFLGPESINLF